MGTPLRGCVVAECARPPRIPLFIIQGALCFPHHYLLQSMLVFRLRRGIQKRLNRTLGSVLAAT
jgi:hypothetical protein